jgi:hypothetical protein
VAVWHVRADRAATRNIDIARRAWLHGSGACGCQQNRTGARAPIPGPDVMRPLFGEAPLHSIEQRAIDQRRLGTRADLALIDDLADVEAIAQGFFTLGLRSLCSCRRIGPNSGAGLRGEKFRSWRNLWPNCWCGDTFSGL